MKIKKIFKSKLFFFILGSIIFSSITAGAATLIYSKDVSYDNSTSGLSSNTVQGALDELYQSAKNGGAKVSCNDSGECTVTCKQGEPTISDEGYACKTKITCPNGKYFIATGTGYKCADIPVNETIVTSGDGLYADTVTKGRYIYRGTNVNNYITFNNELWRIISIENDSSLKIIRNEQMPDDYNWDVNGNRSDTTSTYCEYANSYGCNAWAATKNLVDNPSTFIQYYPNGNTSDSTKYAGTVVQDSTMATYLNEAYYNSLSSTAKEKVVKGIFNVSTPGNENDTESLEIDAQEEKQYQWKGYVGLYTVTELLRASINSNCTSLNKFYNNLGTSPCKSNNWLWPSFNIFSYEWTLSPYVDLNPHYAWIVSKSSANGGKGTLYATAGLRPVLHLSSNISLSGTGSSTDPYRIN